MLFFYQLSLYLYYFLVLLSSLFSIKAKLWIRGRKGVIKKIKGSIRKENKLAWFHCASLGEFEQGRPLIEMYKENYPDHDILLTFFSPSGYEVRKNYDKADYIFYLPLDTPKNARTFLEAVKPDIVFFIKYEFWHYYINEIGKRQIPLYLVSGIFRENQRFFNRFGGEFRKILKQFNHFFVQNIQSQNLLKSIGFENSTVTGDTRFDRVFTIAQQSKALPLIEKFKNKNTVMVLGSSWQHDEEIVIRYFNQTENQFKLIIAPHEVTNDNISRILRSISEKKTVIKYSEATEKNIEKADVLIINSIGILSSLYKYGDFAYIGGGFGKGIHNILEAATFGLPIIFGPNFGKFKEAIDLISLGGASSINNFSEFKKIADLFLISPDSLNEKGKIASQYVSQNKGATKKIIEYISKF